MATARDWADAYLIQGREDFRAACLVGTEVPSTFAMLLQMTFEKLGKAALLRSGSIALKTATTSHKAASRLIATMRIQRGLMAPMGGPTIWSAAFDAVEALENAHPQLAGKAAGTPQLEYPWESRAGAVHRSGRDLPIVTKLSNPRSNLAAHLLDFAAKLERHFDTIFP